MEISRNNRALHLFLAAFCVAFTTGSQIPQSLAAQALSENISVTRLFGSSLAKTDKRKAKEVRPAISTPRQDNDENAVVRVDTTLVVNEVLVQDKKGNVVKGLTQADFLIDEDSVAQQIEVFALGGESAIPRSIILIIDHSFSELPYIATSVDAAKALVDKLRPNDELALVTDDIELLSDFTSDKDLLKSKLDTLKIKVLGGGFGKSKQYSALMASLQELFRDRALRPIILFQTDGDQLSDFAGSSSWNASSGSNTWDDSASLKQLRLVLKETGATVYTIVPGPCFLVTSRKDLLQNAESDLLVATNNYLEIFKKTNNVSHPTLSRAAILLHANLRRRDELALEYFSQVTGGSIEHLERPENADVVYSKVLSDMNKRYLIGYYPTNPERDGRLRRIRIKVRDHSDYVILGRNTYIASGGDGR